MAALVLSVTTACPSEVVVPARKAEVAVALDESDPRVVRQGEDLYPAETIERAENINRDPAPSGLGTGKPDESNGVCRLFAPRLPDPECCKGEYGVDAEIVTEACGLELYLGESFQGTCGYYFHRTGDLPLWLRASFIEGATVADAVAAHDAKLARLTKNDAFASTAVPGVEGAMWSSHEKLHWAFIPGWDKVRLVTWTAATCTDDGMAKVLAHMNRTAKQPQPGAERLGLIPRART
jgi:hypothetical protein